MASDARSQWAGAHDLWLEVFVLFNFVCLTGDIVLAHSENSFRNRAEYIPIVFSAVAALLLVVAIGMRVTRKSIALWKWIGHVLGWSSTVVGIAGVAFHLESGFFYERTLKSLTYTAPFAAPLAYVGLGCLLLMNRMVPFPTRDWARWVLLLTLGGFLGNFALSLSDHAVNGFFHWTEWIPVFSCAIAAGFLTMFFLGEEGPAFSRLCAVILGAQIAVGTLGFLLHGLADWHGPSRSLWQNVIHGAPPFAPMLLPNLALLGLLGLLAWDRVVRQMHSGRIRS